MAWPFILKGQVMDAYTMLMFLSLAVACVTGVAAYFTENTALTAVALTSAVVWGVMMGGW